MHKSDIQTHHTIIPHISVRLSFRLSVCLSLDLHENRSHDSLQTRPMCCPEPDDVQYDLSLYGCGKIIELNDFCVLFAVAHSIALLAGDTGRSYTTDFPSEQSADNPDFTVCMCIVQNWYLADSLLIV